MPGLDGQFGTTDDVTVTDPNAYVYTELSSGQTKETVQQITLAITYTGPDSGDLVLAWADISLPK